MVVKDVFKNHSFGRFIMEKLLESYSAWIRSDSDPRVLNWCLMSSPKATNVICSCYIIFAIFLFHIMKKKEPIDVRLTKWAIWGFNFFQLLSSSSFILLSIKLQLFKDFNLR